MNEAVRVVDVRGMLCPWPVLRLGRAAMELGSTGAIRILADDPVAPRELAQLCAERGWAFSPASDQDCAYDVTIG